jgi:hypothetical protein
LVENKSLSFGPSHKRPKSKREYPPKCLHSSTFVNFGAKNWLNKSLGKTRMETQTMVERRNFCLIKIFKI